MGVARAQEAHGVVSATAASLTQVKSQEY